MVSVSTSYKRLFLRCVKIDAERRAVTFEQVLNECAMAQIEKTASGVTLIQSSGNGQSFNLLPNGGDGLNPTSCAEMIEDITTRFENAKARLIADGNSSPTDSQILTAMMAKLNPVRSFQTDFRLVTR